MWKKRDREAALTHVLVLIDGLFLTDLEALGLLREQFVIMGRGSHLESFRDGGMLSLSFLFLFVCRMDVRLLMPRSRLTFMHWLSPKYDLLTAFEGLLQNSRDQRFYRCGSFCGMGSPGSPLPVLVLWLSFWRCSLSVLLPTISLAVALHCQVLPTRQVIQ